MSPDKQLFRWTAHVVAVFAFAALAACQSMTSQEKSKGVQTGSFTTSDGVRLHYVEAGSGKTLAMIPGWSQTAAQFKAQLDGLSDKYHVFAIDMRGPGESDNLNDGYRGALLSWAVGDCLVAMGR